MEEFLKLYVKNDTLKDSLNFQMTYINGQIPQLRDSKDYNFSLSRIEKKKKTNGRARRKCHCSRATEF